MAGSIRARLTAAVAVLRTSGDSASAEADSLRDAGNAEAAEAARQRAETAYDSAAAVEAVLAPRGHYLLSKEGQRAASSPLTISLTDDLKRALMAAGQEFGVVFSGLAEDAFRRVRDEGWVPPKAARAPRSAGGSKAVLNVRVDAQLRQDVQEMLPGLCERAGYRVTEGSIVVSHLCDELGIERPNAGDAEWLRMVLPAPLVEHLREQVEVEKLTFQKVLEDGLTDLADGVEVLALREWITEVEARPRDGAQWISNTPENPLSMIERAKLDVKLSPDLMDRLRHRAGVESSRHGVLVHVGAVARAILTSRLGEPDDLATSSK